MRQRLQFGEIHPPACACFLPLYQTTGTVEKVAMHAAGKSKFPLISVFSFELAVAKEYTTRSAPPHMKLGP